VLALIVVVLGLPGSSRGQGFDKAVLDRVKDATVLIKLKAGSLQGSGSGFVMRVTGDTVLVMTNRHVAAPDADELPPGTKAELAVVFRSGTAQEQELPARLLAHDEREVRDLAVLEVKGVRAPPTAIPADQTATEADYFETMQAYALGFPLGGMIQQVAGNIKANPAVTVNSMTISSLRRDENNKLARVQFAGSMIEGNSGGPVVDAKGRLVGVVVSRLRGENVGFAIPPSVIASFLAGDVDRLMGRLENWAGTTARLQLVGRLIDPLGKIKSAAVRYARQPTAPIPTKPDLQGNWPLLTGGEEVPMVVKDGSGFAQFNVQAATPVDRKLLLQIVLRDNFGRVVASKPAPVILPDRPGPLQGMETIAKPRALANWSCEANLEEGVKITHKPGSTTIKLPAGVARNNAPQFSLLNAPCALVKVEGNFRVAVGVANTFDPGGKGVAVPKGKFPYSFQSAGILIWQDENNFIRLERSKGSSGGIGMVHRVLIEVYKDGKEVEVHYEDVSEAPVVLLAAIRKGASVQLLFAVPPDGLGLTREMAMDFNKEVYVGVAAANLSQRDYEAKFVEFHLTDDSGQAVEVKPVKMTKLVDPGFEKLPDGTLVYEGAGLKVNRPRGSAVLPVAAQEMTEKGKWSNDRQLLWSNDKAGPALILDLPVEAKGKYEIKGRFTQGPSYAEAKFEIDGKPLWKGKRMQLYSPQLKPTGLASLGTYELEPGKHRLTITVFAKDPKATGYHFGLDEIQLVPVK
jgi:S1-C subfamily serine protease/regulation of enolase protein 1 (concanavalin A-like superfamily)